MQFFLVLGSLLPPGHFWEIKSGSAFHRLLLALSDELERVFQLLTSIPNFISYEENPSRFMTLLGLKETLLKSLDQQKQAIASILNREGNLSRSYIEQRLRALGYSIFTIHDPTEDDMGIEPIVDPDLIGMITVKTQIIAEQHLCAGFRAGDSLTYWRDDEFERHVKSLIPAHTQAKFLYRKKENLNA